MATRIILIDKRVPQHWDYAKRNGFWDLQKDWQGIGTGDTVYFWVTGTPGRVVGRARVTSDKIPLASNEPHAWSPDDSRMGDYHFRIMLTDFLDLPAVRIDWHEVRDHAQAPGRLNPVTLVPETGVPWFERRLGLDPDPYDEASEGMVDGAEGLVDISGIGDDRREMVPKSVVLRRGRKAFRDSLISAYQGKCAVTGTAVEAVLEAAHISGYRGSHTDREDNGLLLRADIHTLFDLHLMTVVAKTHLIQVSPKLKGSLYENLSDQPLASPTDKSKGPNEDLLAQHNAACSWLST